MPPAFTNFLLLLLFLQISHFFTATRSEPIFRYCSGDSYTSSSTYDSNLRHLLANVTASVPNSSSLSAHTVEVGGSPSYQIFGSAQCRPDASKLACANCLRKSVSMLTADADGGGCSRRIFSVIAQDLCLLRYSNQSFSGQLDLTRIGLSYGAQNAANTAEFSRQVDGLMGEISREAATAESRFAVGTTDDKQLKQKIDGMAWCAGDLSRNCFQCLLDSVEQLPTRTVGGRITLMKCLNTEQIRK